MARFGNSVRRARFESLEQRQLLAGDVLVNVVGGNLMVQGDALDNKIMITAGADAGTFVVTGLDGTTVHEEGGAAASAVTVSGVRSANVRLGEGNDLVAVVGANLRGHLAIGTGAGEDRVLIGTGGDAAELVGLLPEDVSVNVRGSLHINTNGDNDQVSVDDAMIGGLLAIDAGENDDEVSLGSAAPVDMAARVRAGGSVHVNLGAGNDELNMDQLGVRGGILARGGSGNNTVNASLTHASAMVVFGDGGVDTVTLADLDIHHLGIHTGDGNDHVDVRDSAFASLGVSLGAGNDTLTTSALQARVAILLGGEGEDTFDLVSENDFSHQLIRGFEFPPDVNINELPPLRRLLGGLLNRPR